MIALYLNLIKKWNGTLLFEKFTCKSSNTQCSGSILIPKAIPDEIIKSFWSIWLIEQFLENQSKIAYFTMEMTFVAFLAVSSICDAFHSWKIRHKGGPLISLTQYDGKDAIKYHLKCIYSQFMKIITSLYLRQIIVRRATVLLSAVLY